MDRYDGADGQALRIDGAEARCDQCIPFQDIRILGDVDELRFRRHVAVAADDRGNARFRTLDDSADAGPRVRQELDAGRMRIDVADEADDTARRDDRHVFFDAFAAADIDDHGVGPRAVVTGNDRTSQKLVLIMGRFEIEERPQAVVFGYDFIVVDSPALEVGIFFFQRFPFNAVLQADIDDVDARGQRIHDAAGTVFKRRHDRHQRLGNERQGIALAPGPADKRNDDE